MAALNLNKTKARIKAAAYCRVSTDKDDQLMSLAAQQEFFKEYAQKNDLDLLPLYADEGISGTNLKNRKAFNKMMEDAKKGMFEVLFVKDISRFARNAVDFLTSIRKLKSMGIQCKFITSNLSTEDGEFTLGILALVAQEESANLSKRVKFGKEKNARKGKVPNFVYGYDKKKGELFNLKINPIEAAVVKRIYEMYLVQGYGANKIARILNEEGLKTKRGCNWSQNAVSRILQNQIYIGKIINCKEYIEDYLIGIRKKNSIENQYVTDRPNLAIISKEDFDKVQQIFKKRKAQYKIATKRRSTKYPFSTLIKCASCGYSFRRITRTYVNTYTKWTCSGRNANGKDFCDNRTFIEERTLIDAIRKYILNNISNKDRLIKKTISEFKSSYKSIENIIDEKALADEIARLKRVRQKQMQMFEADAITIEELKERTAQINTDIKRYEQELYSLQSSKSFVERAEENAKKYCGNIKALLSEENINNGALRKLIDKIVVDKNGQARIYIKQFSDSQIA